MKLTDLLAVIAAVVSFRHLQIAEERLKIERDHQNPPTV